MTYRLGLTAIGRRATISKRSKKDPRLAVGTPQDVHQDFLSCILEFCEHGKVVQQITKNGVPVFEIIVRDLRAPPPVAASEGILSSLQADVCGTEGVRNDISSR